MDNPATAPIPAYSGPTSTEDQQYWLDVAWRSLLAEEGLGDLVARIQANELDEATVADVVTAAARRVLRNPDGNEEEAGSIDDYDESWKKADSTEDVYFTSAELRRLKPTDRWVGGFSGSVKYC